MRCLENSLERRREGKREGEEEGRKGGEEKGGDEGIGGLSPVTAPVTRRLQTASRKFMSGPELELPRTEGGQQGELSPQ